MSLRRRQLLRVAGTGVAVGLAGCSGLLGGGGSTPASGVQAEASVNVGLTRQGTPAVSVVWQVNRDADYLSVTVENTTTGESTETALCGVGAAVNFGGDGSAQPKGPVGSPPDCESGSPSGVPFAPGETVSVTVTAHFGDDTTVDIASEESEIPEPPTPTPTSNSG
jgi:hypothetical protein